MNPLSPIVSRMGIGGLESGLGTGGWGLGGRRIISAAAEENGEISLLSCGYRPYGRFPAVSPDIRDIRRSDVRLPAFHRQNPERQRRISVHAASNSTVHIPVGGSSRMKETFTPPACPVLFPDRQGTVPCPWRGDGPSGRRR